MSQDGAVLPMATEMNTDSNSTIKLKEHQIALFEKCKYKEPKSGVSNTATDDCLVEDIECNTSEECYKNEIDFLKKTVERQAAQINRLNETINHQQTKIDELTNDLTGEITENATKKRKMQNVESLINTTIMEDASNKDIEIAALSTENNKLKEQIENQNKESEQATKIDRQPMRISEQLEKSIEEKLTRGLQSLKADLEKILIKRCEAEQDELTSSPTKQVLDYSKAIQKTGHQQTAAESFRDIARMAKMEELEEENQKRLRQANIIIHGKKENESTSSGSDEDFMNALLKELCVGAVKAKFMVRIGKREDGKARPLKVTFHNENDKIKVLDNLKHLKGKSEFDGISIKEDFTISERNLIKEYVQKANEKNLSEPKDCEYVWRVRGSPKNRLFLKKVMKEKKISQ